MNDDMETIKGTGNPFKDLGYADADREQLRSLLAAEIIGVMDERDLTLREAQELTGIAAADFSRIRNEHFVCIGPRSGSLHKSLSTFDRSLMSRRRPFIEMPFNIKTRYDTPVHV
jgi:hypothetical protein